MNLRQIIAHYGSMLKAGKTAEAWKWLNSIGLHGEVVEAVSDVFIKRSKRGKDND